MATQTKKCPMCAETIPLEAETCEYCGAQLAVTVTGYCAHCHEMREADANGRCRVCGSEVMDRRVESKFIDQGQIAPSQPSAPASVPIPETAPVLPSPPPPPLARKRGSPWAWVLGAAVLAFLCTAGAGSMYWAGSSGLLTGANPFASRSATSTPAPSSTPSVTMEPVRIRWLVGIGSGTDPAGNDLNATFFPEQVVSDFNASHSGVQLVLEKVPSDSFGSILSAEMAAGNNPDIAGPMGVAQASSFHGQWLDLTPYIESGRYDASTFSPALMAFLHTGEGQLSLPFEVYPAAIFYQKELFDRAGLNYPPASYGEPYIWPDGTAAEWNYNTLADVAKLLTIDSQGRNAAQKGFNHDQNKIRQFGFVYQWTDPIHTAGFWGGGGKPFAGQPGNYSAVFPEQWKAAWKWYYEGMWGPQLYIPSYASPIMDNPFGTGRVAMAITHTWYTCCIADAGNQWDLAALPSNHGVVHGVIHADSFYIRKNTPHPDEAFDVLAYLISPVSQARLAIYFAIPGAKDNQDAFFSRMAGFFPWVTNWKIFQAGLEYLDIPSVEGYWPNSTEARSRISEFDSLMGSNDNLDVDAEIEKLQNDLQAIFNQ